MKTYSPMYMMTLLRVAWLALSVVVLIACGDGEGSSSIKGTVLESQTMAPIDSAWIAESESTDVRFHSDSLGRFTMASFGRPEYVFAGKNGYITRRFELPDDERARQNLIFALEKAGD